MSAATLPDLVGQVDDLVRDLPPADIDPIVFLGEQFDRGLAFPTNPAGLGGQGASAALGAAVAGRLREAGAPNAFARNPVGIGMTAPTVSRHGSPELARRLLRPLFTAEEIWCQLFSEPEAGSDLAGVMARAVPVERAGGGWTVDGQKLWTSLAHVARWALLLVRTGSAATRSHGLTYFALDMTTPGITVRALRQMTGDAEFNEVFLDDVHVDDSCRLGDVGDGWAVARTTLASERSTLGAPRSAGQGAMSHLLRVWNSARDQLAPATLASRRDEVVARWIDHELMRLNGRRAAASKGGEFAAANGMLGKLAWARTRQATYSLATSLLGPAGTLYPVGYEMVRTEPGVGFNHDVRTGMLRSRANSIEGGTSEILRNVIAERVLGLPRE